MVGILCHLREVDPKAPFRFNTKLGTTERYFPKPNSVERHLQLNVYPECARPDSTYQVIWEVA